MSAHTLTLAAQVVVVQSGAVHWQGGMAVSSDGDPRAYHPTDDAKALDYLKSAGHPGDWWGVVTDKDGLPVVQGPDDPAPGFLISTTALVDGTKRERDPARYVWASEVPYISLPREVLALGVQLGDLALVVYRGVIAPAIVADVGPAGKLGEGSIDLARRLGIPSSAKHGGASGYVTFLVFMGSHMTPRWPHTIDEIAEHAHAAGDAWVRRVADEGGTIPDALHGPLRGGPCGE